MDYFEKISKNPYADLYWNIPEEQKQGAVAMIGGNEQNFRVPVQTAEYLAKTFPVKEVKTVLPDSLKSKLPGFDNLVFLGSTESGSFADGEGLAKVIDGVDFSLMVGDFSKNTITASAIKSAVLSSAKNVLIARDTLDLLAGAGLERVLMRENLTIMGSVAQWQKALRAIYYPKMLMMSQSLVQVAEVFHKFTLSYPVQVISLHDGQILLAKNGKVAVVPLAESGYTPFTVWSGELVAKILALNLYNPDKFIEASVAAIYYTGKN